MRPLRSIWLTTFLFLFFLSLEKLRTSRTTADNSRPGVNPVTNEENEIDLDLFGVDPATAKPASKDTTHTGGEVLIMDKSDDRTTSFFAQPGILAGTILITFYTHFFRWAWAFFIDSMAFFSMHNISNIYLCTYPPTFYGWFNFFFFFVLIFNYMFLFSHFLHVFSCYWGRCCRFVMCHFSCYVHCLSNAKKGRGFVCIGRTEKITSRQFVRKKCK